MKANELSCKDLMVGDWVKPKNVDVSFRVGLIGVDSVWNDTDTHEWYYDELEPISLTAEILEKNGFVKFIAGQYLLPAEGNEWVVTIVPNLASAPNSNGTMLIAIKNIYTDAKIAITYVHQLQHTLRLCGIEKEIEL